MKNSGRIARDLPRPTDTPANRQAAMVTSKGVAPQPLKVAPVRGSEAITEWTESPVTRDRAAVHKSVVALLGTRSWRVRIIGFLEGLKTSMGAQLLGRCICGIFVLRRSRSWRNRLATGAPPDDGCRACNRSAYKKRNDRWIVRGGEVIDTR